MCSKLSYRGRILVTNNLVASTMWHKITVLHPPAGLIEEIKEKTCDFFFWSGQHWIRAAALYLQGLLDIRSRMYHMDLSWLKTASALPRRVRIMGLNKHLFLMELQYDDCVNLTSFYKSVLEAWKVFTISRSSDTHARLWLFEEPIYLDDFLPSILMSGLSLRACLTAAGCTKLGHILNTITEELRKKGLG